MDMVAERAASKSVELALLIEEGDINVGTDSSQRVSLYHNSPLCKPHRSSETSRGYGRSSSISFRMLSNSPRTARSPLLPRLHQQPRPMMVFLNPVVVLACETLESVSQRRTLTSFSGSFLDYPVHSV